MTFHTSTGANPLHIRYDKIDGFIKTHNKLDVQYYLMSGVITFVIGSMIL